MAKGSAWRRHPLCIKYIDHRVFDAAARGDGRRHDPQMHQQRPAGAKMGENHRVACHGGMPIADPRQELLIAFAAGRHKVPGVLFAHGQQVRGSGFQVGKGPPVPVAEGHFGEARIKAIAEGIKSERHAHQFHAGAGAVERARDIIEVRRRTAVARQEAAQDFAAALRLGTAGGTQRIVRLALQPLLGVPLGFAVADVIEDGRLHRRLVRPHSLWLTVISGASGCFMPTMW